MLHRRHIGPAAASPIPSPASRRPPRRRSPAGYHVEPLEWRAYLSGLDLPFMASNYSYLDGTAPEPAASMNRRTVGLASPSGFVLLGQQQPTYDPAGHATAGFNWPAPKTVTRTDPVAGVAVGGAYAQMEITVSMRQFDKTETLDQAMAAVDKDFASGTKISEASVAAPWTISGGGLAGRQVQIEARTARYRVPGADTPNYATEAMTLAYLMPWGIDPSEHANFVEVLVDVDSALSTTDAAALPLNDVAAETMGAGSMQEYHNTVLTQVAGQPQFSGAIPDLLFLYDFSGNTTRSPGDFQAPDYANQYEQPTLPVRYGARCGNACGPSSLKMALSEAGSGAVIKDVFDNTMSAGTPATDFPGETSQLFQWQSGQDYAKARLGSSHNVLARDGDTWANIDANLNARKPVLVGTKLGTGAAPGKSDGHVMLLLGVGNDALIKASISQLYGSGDYYIVADPAGHFFGDASTNAHYGTTASLRAMAKGINYGGWFAVYPKAELTNYVPDMRTLTIDPIKPAIKAAAHSPVSIVVTDPLGRRSGVLPDGTVLDEIPDGGYQVWVAEEFGGAPPTYDPEKEKAVVLSDPPAGTYQVQLVGTGTGPYHLDINVLTPGGGTATTTYAGTVTPGEVKTYTFGYPQTGAPTVTQVYLSGSSWTPSFKQSVAAGGGASAQYGFPVPATGQLESRAWSDVNEVSITFDRPVQVDANDLKIRGVNVADYVLDPAAFHYDPATLTATWRLAGGNVFRNDRILLDLDADSPAGVKTAAGVFLDGDWINPVGLAPTAAGGDAYPSGDGTPGGDFRFRINLLPGDVNHSGAADAADVLAVRSRLGRAAGGADYLATADLDGNGTIVVRDLALARAASGARLPSTQPATAGADPIGLATPLLTRRRPAARAAFAELLE